MPEQRFGPDEPDQALVVCTPVHDLVQPVAGSIIMECANCREDIWVSPSSDELIRRGAIPYCPRCAHDRMSVVAATGEEIVLDRSDTGLDRLRESDT